MAPMAFIGNLSNQANLCSTKDCHLLQLNVVAAIGLELLREKLPTRTAIPLGISIKSNGEMDINGIDGVTIADEHIRVHADRKVTNSPD